MSPSAPRSTRIRRNGAAALWVALFGRETRYVGRLYAGRAFIFAALALCVVLSLDAANHIGGFLADQAQPGAPSGLVRLSYYLMLRGGYNLPAILPIAALVGVIWAEFALSGTRQRIMIANSGQPALRSLAPAIVVGLAIGIVQFVALAYVRPACVEAQAVAGFRYYGPKFSAPAETADMWISVEGAVIATRIAFTDPPTLRDAIIYDLADDGALRSIRTARSAVPAQAGTWTMSNGSHWQVPDFSAPSATGEVQHADLYQAETIALALDPLWVTNIDIQPMLLPQSVLAEIGAAARGVQNAAAYRAALQERFAAVFYVIGMALLPAALGICWFLPGMGPGPLLRVIFLGVGAYFFANVVSQLGAYGYLPPLISAWSAPVMLVGSSFAAVLGGTWRQID